MHHREPCILCMVWVIRLDASEWPSCSLLSLLYCKLPAESQSDVRGVTSQRCEISICDVTYTADASLVCWTIVWIFWLVQKNNFNTICFLLIVFVIYQCITTLQCSTIWLSQLTLHSYGITDKIFSICTLDWPYCLKQQRQTHQITLTMSEEPSCTNCEGGISTHGPTLSYDNRPVLKWEYSDSMITSFCLQCSDTDGWMSGAASSL